MPPQFVTIVNLHLQAYVSSGLTWAIARAMNAILNPIVKQCVLN
jgi:hypothetical protein